VTVYKQQYGRSAAETSTGAADKKINISELELKFCVLTETIRSGGVSKSQSFLAINCTNHHAI